MDPHKGKIDKRHCHDNPCFVADIGDRWVPPIIVTPASESNNNAGEVSTEEVRPTFDNPLEFLLSCISMSVGLGNVWRFPGVAAKNGGGAFLIPYLIVLLLIGRPIYYLEMCIGQFSSTGQVKVWSMAPIFKGVGYGSLTAVICICSYYCSIMALTLYYFGASFSSVLPWAVCTEPEVNGTSCNGTEGDYARLYYTNTVYPQLDNIDSGLGSLNIPLAICLAISWFLIFLSLVRGVKSSGKVAYFTAIFPYVVLIILLIRGVTLPGAWTGIKVFLEPQWEKLLEPSVWYAAIEQCFFSLGIGLGAVTMFSSYNKFRQNIYKDAMIISFMDTFTSFLAGITVFAVIGNLMEVNNLSFDEIKKKISGPGLAFILYPQAIASFGWLPQLFAVLFFLMFFTLGIGSATSLIGAVITVICDQFPTWKRWLVTLVVTTFGCITGLMYVTEGGSMMIDLIDHYGAGFVIYIMVVFECIGVCWVYGLENLCNDIEFMLQRKTGPYWRLCWAFIIPVGLSINLIYYLWNNSEFKSGDVSYPVIATVCGWLLTTFAVAMIPAWAIHAILTRKGETLKEKFSLSLKPSKDWRPKQEILYQEWEEFRTEKEFEEVGPGILSSLSFKFRSKRESTHL